LTPRVRFDTLNPTLYSPFLLQARGVVHLPPAGGGSPINKVLFRHAEPSDYQPIIAVVNEWHGGRRRTSPSADAGLAAFRTALLVCGVLVLIGLAAVADAAQLKLDWEDNSNNESGFRIERRTEPGGTYVGIAVTSSNATCYVDTTVTEGVTYCYEVLAYNEAGNSAPSNEACATASATSGSGETSCVAVSVGVGGGGGGGGGGCFISTAAFGSPLAPQVQRLREVRDTYLLPYPAGRAAVQAYYAVSPPIADVISRSEMLRTVVRFGLMPIVGWASLALWSPGVGLGIPLLPVVVSAWLIRRRTRQH